jgi:hypothetical protein
MTEKRDDSGAVEGVAKGEQVPPQGGRRRRSGKKARSAGSEGAPKADARAGGGGATPTNERWRSLAAITVSIENFSKEAVQLADKWPGTATIDVKKRAKAAAEAGQLVAWGINVQARLLYFLGRLPSRPDDKAPRKLEAAWRRLQAIDMVSRLQTIIDGLTKVRDRLREEYPSACAEKIDDDFRSVMLELSQLNTEAKSVRGSLQARLGGVGLHTSLTTALTSLIGHVTNAITKTTGGIGDTWVQHSRFAVRLPERIKRAKKIRAEYEKLKDTLTTTFDDKLKRLLGTDSNEVQQTATFLEGVALFLNTVRSAEEYASSREEAASKGIDEDLRAEAKELESQLDALRLDYRTLADAVWYYRDMVARAPFKRLLPVKPMPPWERLQDRERSLLTVLITCRTTDPAGQWYAVSRQLLEERLGLGDNDATLNRTLKQLDEEHGIVGKYQPIASASDKQPAFGYWIEEYAYKLYGPRVLNSDGSEASSESQTS